MEGLTEEKNEELKLLKNGFSSIIYAEDIIDNTELSKFIGKRVSNEYGKGVVVGIEIFIGGFTFPRYLVEITENTGKEILKSLFPDNRLCFHKKELKFLRKH